MAAGVSGATGVNAPTASPDATVNTTTEPARPSVKTQVNVHLATCASARKAGPAQIVHKVKLKSINY